MPDAFFDKQINLPGGTSEFFKLKKAGDKIKFRIAKTPKYKTQHFLSKDEVVLCGKYNSEDKTKTCKYCDDYKKAIEIGDEETKTQLKPVTTFYYPVVNLNDPESPQACIFQFTAPSIHYFVSDYAKEGVDVFGCDWVVERTEEKGPNYYKRLRLDNKPLSEKAKIAFEEAKKIDLAKYADTSSESVAGEDISLDDINF